MDANTDLLTAVCLVFLEDLRRSSEELLLPVADTENGSNLAIHVASQCSKVATGNRDRFNTVVGDNKGERDITTCFRHSNWIGCLLDCDRRHHVSDGDIN